MSLQQNRITIEGVTPSVDNGRFSVKAVTGEYLTIGADIFKDGHEKLRAVVLWRPYTKTHMVPQTFCSEPASFSIADWRESPLSEEVNDRWFGALVCDSIGDWMYTIGAWTDVFGSWRDDLRKKVEAGADITSALFEGARIVEQTLSDSKPGHLDSAEFQTFLDILKGSGEKEKKVSAALDNRLAALMAFHDPRPDLTLYQAQIPLWIDRRQAVFGSWYQIFVRSQGKDPNRSATFLEAEKRLPYLSSLGFNILCLTPIHPIGISFRRGKNNMDNPGLNDPGNCWAIGSKAGGHTAIHPDLGTIGDFDQFVAEAKEYDIEIALDFAVQCSPDHPWVKEHPAWFKHNPDEYGKYTENSPKRNKDIFPIDFDTEDREGLYNELLNVVLFWIKHGVKIFRVDNAHTKPVSFWEWLLFTVRQKHPDVLFLADAFTRPKRIARLAKIGFTQSYTYFIWRNSREELESYGRELFGADVRDYLRPNFFINTPDILPDFLQDGGRPAFIIRLVLAATMSPTYGIYSGFELCENTPMKPGSEEYRNSEKYEIKPRDWNLAENIKTIITRINSIRKDNPALQVANNFQVLESTCPHIIAYAKACSKKNNRIIVIVNLDPHNTHEGTVGVPEQLLAGAHAYRVKDLLNNEEYLWHGYWNYVKLDPLVTPAHVLRIEE
jgi:starch synthase (maltosyl-transferring)